MHLRGQLVHRIVPEDLGRRVSVRITLPEGGFTDIVGVVESWTENVLTLRRRDDSTVEVAEADIVASRVVPPVPPRRRGGRPPEAP
ncbi:putative acetyltransferase [Nocardiopsis terrae]